MPLQTSMNLVTITLAVRVCPGCEPIDQMVLKTTQQKGKNREEREERRNWMLAICYKCFILNFALIDAPSPSSPSWFDEANCSQNYVYAFNQYPSDTYFWPQMQAEKGKS